MSAQAKRKLKSLVYVTASGIVAFTGISIYKSNEKFYSNVLMPVVQLLDAETAHRLGVLTFRYRLLPKPSFTDGPELKVQAFGINFPNPVGIAAGFDKDAEAVSGLGDIGFGFVEVGTVTPQPQPGNDKPRIFRLKDDLAVINRYGFNSKGHEYVYDMLSHFNKTPESQILPLGVNLGKNKTSENAIEDYTLGIEKLGPVADYVVINVSSPNTPGLRSLQGKKELRSLLRAVVKVRNELPLARKPALLLKLAPDLSEEERRDVAEVVTRPECQVDGLIVCNTTVQRPESLRAGELAKETGGLSGQPLKDMSTEMIAEMHLLTGGQVPIIGVGGIATGHDAYEKIKAGATLVQIYTSMVYEGPPVVTKIKRELQELLARDGYASVAEARGTMLQAEYSAYAEP